MCCKKQEIVFCSIFYLLKIVKYERNFCFFAKISHFFATCQVYNAPICLFSRFSSPFQRKKRSLKQANAFLCPYGSYPMQSISSIFALRISAICCSPLISRSIVIGPSYPIARSFAIRAGKLTCPSPSAVSRPSSRPSVG